jgi:hypothetical protein
MKKEKVVEVNSELFSVEPIKLDRPSQLSSNTKFYLVSATNKNDAIQLYARRYPNTKIKEVYQYKQLYYFDVNHLADIVLE